jgi:hypothetical protein
MRAGDWFFFHVCGCMYVTHTYSHTYMRICIHTWPTQETWKSRMCAGKCFSPRLAYIHIHIHTHTQVKLRMCIHTHTHMYIQIKLRRQRDFVCARAIVSLLDVPDICPVRNPEIHRHPVQTRPGVFICVCVYLCVCLYIDAHVYVRTFIHTYIHTYNCMHAVQTHVLLYASCTCVLLCVGMIFTHLVLCFVWVFSLTQTLTLTLTVTGSDLDSDSDCDWVWLRL